MTRHFGSLWSRMLAAQILVLLVGAATLVAVSELLAPSFFESDVELMNAMMTGTNMMMDGSMMGDSSAGFLTPAIEIGLQQAFDSSLRRALLISLAIAVLAATVVSGFVTRRILSPLQTVRDTTRRLAAGAYAERIEPPAEKELAALAEDVNALAESLDSTERRRIRMMSDISHELRTPLTTIEGYLEGMLDGVFEPTDEILAASGRELRRLTRLADDLSAVSRAEEGNQPLDLENLDLADLAHEVGSHLRVQFDAKGVQLVIEDPMQATPVFADRDRISQVLTNVIGNALTYTSPGGKVTISVRAEDGEAVVEVTDTGRGLGREEEAAVFERFYRGHHGEPGGSGIGLTIARAIARRHGGDLIAHSPGPGHGSTFALRIPST